ncbi:MAG: thiamine ABC transporter ATP-binding protein, partial [Rhodobacterales bacterium 12-65-15]
MRLGVAVLQLDHLTLTRGAFRLTGNWTADPGQRVVLMGPSGAGKSSLLAAIAGFLPLTAGAVRWNGHDLGPMLPGERPLTILF